MLEERLGAPPEHPQCVSFLQLLIVTKDTEARAHPEMSHCLPLSSIEAQPAPSLLSTDLQDFKLDVQHVIEVDEGNTAVIACHLPESHPKAQVRYSVKHEWLEASRGERTSRSPAAGARREGGRLCSASQTPLPTPAAPPHARQLSSALTFSPAGS